MLCFAEIPDFKDYQASCIGFYEDSLDWLWLPSHFFTTVPHGGWMESCDNAHGGLDVSWAFWGGGVHGVDEVKEYARGEYNNIIASLIGLEEDEIEYLEERLAQGGTEERAEQDAELKDRRGRVAELKSLIVDGRA